jgi:hypothetical protein
LIWYAVKNRQNSCCIGVSKPPAFNMTAHQEEFLQRTDIWWKVQRVRLAPDFFQIQAARNLSATVRQNLPQAPASLVWISQAYLGNMTREMNYRLERYSITFKNDVRVC